MNLVRSLSTFGHAIRRNSFSSSSRSITRSVISTRLSNGPNLKRSPWRFWDMHTPKTALYFRERGTEEGYNVALPITSEMSRDWCAIPETHLPVPWSCEWTRWQALIGRLHPPNSPKYRAPNSSKYRERRERLSGGWDGVEPLPNVLRRWYGIPGALNPIIFRNADYDCTTVLESRGTFYLFEQLALWWLDGDHQSDHVMFKFPGTYKTVDDFMENCDWNGMEKMQEGNHTVVPDPDVENLPLTHSERGLRRASSVPYPKCNLLAMTSPEGTWGFQDRERWNRRRRSQSEMEHTTTWPSIPDEQLPAPFSCNWHIFDPTREWYYMNCFTSPRRFEDVMLERWGVPDLTPVMFMQMSRDDTAHFVPAVLRSGDTYYMWMMEDEVYPWLRKFEGEYVSVEDFMENGDWNQLSEDLEDPVDYWR
ncbi:hypothetical protein DFH06DRAFT_541188 [Mycena polygramma]|nr:hypothetical protein DFH06DRAFT_541188 [Mycena polygramma]